MRPVSVSKNLTDNTATTLYTVPTGYYANCVHLHVANSTSSNKHISISWYDTSASLSIPINFETTISSKTSFDAITSTQYFVMEEGDYITATSEAGATMSIVGTFEINGAQRT
jgi:hypothetical protein